MAKKPITTSRMNLSMPSRMKRRIQELSQDQGISMNDLILHALRDYLDKSVGTYQNADLVADRLAQVLNSQMAVVNQLNQLTRTISNQ